MARVTFSWEGLGGDVVVALARSFGQQDAEVGASAEMLDQRFGVPSEDFVSKNLDLLRDTWLSRDEWSTAQAYEFLWASGVIDADRRHRSTHSARLKWLKQRRASALLTRVLWSTLIRAGEGRRGRLPGEDLLPLEIVDTGGGTAREPREHQRSALDALKRSWHDDGGVRGILVMPTGSGKTFVAVRWLLEDVIRVGGRVLWVAHRQMLLEQAAWAFIEHASAVDRPERLRVRTVSGAHAPTKAIGPDDQIVVASVQSLARRPDIAREFLEDAETVLVVDEAHHGTAPTYRQLLDLATSPRPRALGLTATPTRLSEDEAQALWDLFGNRIIHQTSPTELIRDRVLAKPLPETVKTERDYEPAFTESDISHLARWGDLSERLLEQIGTDGERNRIIVDHYLTNRAHYGKTLVFATNVAHCMTLTKHFNEAGVRAGWVSYIGSDTPSLLDGGGARGESATATIERFRSGDIDVLVNVNILTEGSDIPSIETVFLARPTQSHVLLRQMVGRGMRGPMAGGTESVNLVSFVDHWSRFPDWLDAFEVLAEEGLLPEELEPGPPPPEVVQYPIELLREIARIAAERSTLEALSSDAALPIGWFDFQDELDDAAADEGASAVRRVLVPVFSHQRSGFEQLPEIERMEPDIPGEEQRIKAAAFASVPDPLPSDEHLAALIRYAKANGRLPPMYLFAERDRIDPVSVAERVKDLPGGERRAAVETAAKSQPEIVRRIWGSPGGFAAAVHRQLAQIDFPVPVPEAAGPRLEALRSLQPGPFHDLHDIYRAVAQSFFPTPRKVPAIRWSTGRPMEPWAFYRDSDCTIVIHSVLDSPDVPREVLEFLMFHELIHLEHPDWGHNDDFRRVERNHPHCIEGDRFLDTFHERFASGEGER